MTCDWDPAKSARNWQQRGFDVAFASGVFDHTYVEYDDTRRDVGERRVVAVGLADGVPLTVAFTYRVDLARLRRRTDAEIEATSPLELRNVPDDFWQGARVVMRAG